MITPLDSRSLVRGCLPSALVSSHGNPRGAKVEKVGKVTWLGAYSPHIQNYFAKKGRKTVTSVTFATHNPSSVR